MVSNKVTRLGSGPAVELLVQLTIWVLLIAYLGFDIAGAGHILTVVAGVVGVIAVLSLAALVLRPASHQPPAVPKPRDSVWQSLNRWAQLVVLIWCAQWFILFMLILLRMSYWVNHALEELESEEPSFPDQR